MDIIAYVWILTTPYNCWPLNITAVSAQKPLTTIYNWRREPNCCQQSSSAICFIHVHVYSALRGRWEPEHMKIWSSIIQTTSDAIISIYFNYFHNTIFRRFSSLPSLFLLLSLSFHLSLPPLSLSVSLTFHVSLRLSLRLSLFLSTSLSISLSVFLRLSISVSLFRLSPTRSLQFSLSLPLSLSLSLRLSLPLSSIDIRDKTRWLYGGQ